MFVNGLAESLKQSNVRDKCLIMWKWYFSAVVYQPSNDFVVHAEGLCQSSISDMTMRVVEKKKIKQKKSYVPLASLW